MQTVDTTNFEQQVLQASQPVLVEFGAVWCAPCKRMEPVLEELSAQWDGCVHLMKVDVDLDPDLAMRFQVMSVPTMILLKGGQEQQRLVGLQSRERIIEKISPYI
ncbi:MAG: thioredoxin [Anaerolineae bacterium]|nr:thioredoxin [Anaerolineae bacterium]